MISLHHYNNGQEILMNIDNAQYITQTEYKGTIGNQANAVVTFSDETCFYVKETLEDIKKLMAASTVPDRELIDGLEAEISYGNSSTLNRLLTRAAAALRK